MRQARRLVASICVLVATAHGGNDITVTISHSYIEQAVVARVKQVPNLPLTNLAWTAKLTRTGATSLHVHVGGRIPGGSNEEAATVDLDVTLGCGATAAGASNACNAQSHLKIAVANFQAASVLETLPDATRTQIETALQSEAARISSELSCRLNDGFAWLDRDAICPVFEVTSKGTIKATLDFVSGCITGTTKTDPCPSKYQGNGVTYACTNGRWVRQSWNCIYVEGRDSRRPQR